LSDLSQNPLLQYLARLAPSSQQTMRYILQDAADRLGFVDCNLLDVPWHRLEPGHVIGLVAALRTDGYAPNSSSLYVNAIRGVMNEAWRQGLIDHEQLLRIREVKPATGSRLPPGRNLRRSLIRGCSALGQQHRVERSHWRNVRTAQDSAGVNDSPP